MRATKVNAGPAESNGRLLLGIWRDSLHVTCGQTACTPGSAPGPTFGNEYGKTSPLPLPPYVYSTLSTLAVSRRTLSDVFDRADRNVSVVKSGRVVCRVVSVEAATSLDHVTLIARLLTRLCTNFGNYWNITLRFQSDFLNLPFHSQMGQYINKWESRLSK